MKNFILVPLAALFLAFSAKADPIHTLTMQQSQADDGLKDLVEIHTARSPGKVILQDALYGGIAGLAIGGGVALLSNDGNWGRDLAIGAGAGLLIGGIFGAVDAASYSDVANPVGRMRDVGLSHGFSPIGGKF